MTTSLRLGDPHHVFEHQRRIGEKRPAGIGDHLDARERLGIDAMHEAGKIIGLLRRHHVAVHDMQRIAGLPHVQARQRPPSAADGIERAALAVLQQTRTARARSDDLLRLLDRFRRDVLQSQAAERQRHARLDAVAVNFGQLERAAAEIADDAVGLVEAGDDAERGKLAPRACRTGRRSCARRCALPRRRRICRSWRRGRRRLQSPKAPPTSSGRTARGNVASAASAFSTASAARSPVVWTSRPSPASTFSLKIGVGLRVRPS